MLARSRASSSARSPMKRNRTRCCAVPQSRFERFDEQRHQAHDLIARPTQFSLLKANSVSASTAWRAHSSITMRTGVHPPDARRYGYRRAHAPSGRCHP